MQRRRSNRKTLILEPKCIFKVQEKHAHMRPMAVTHVITVTWVYADYNSYLKLGTNQKKRGLDCRARQALFALIMTIIIEISVVETPPY
jgi:hypothetical protein